MCQSSSSTSKNVTGGSAEPDQTAWIKGGKHPCRHPHLGPLNHHNKVWRIVLLGAPGVGKGTQAKLLGESLGSCHLSTRTVFRTAQESNGEDFSPALKNGLDYLNRGDVVPDETVLNLVGERLKCLKCSGGFLLDGFPRTVPQAKALEQLLDSQDCPLSAVIHYELPIEPLVARLSGGRTCTHCQAVYHVTTHRPKIAEVCDRCGGALLQHKDDRLASARVRTAAYQQATQPLLDYYQQRGLLVNVAAHGTPAEVRQRTQLSVRMRD